MKTAASVVIPAYQSADTIAETIEACLNQDYPNVEVIVVDDGSTDETAQIVQAYPVHYIHQKNAGPATARNLGWIATSGDIVCFTDADCIPARDWVSNLMAEYTADDIAGVGGTYDIVNRGSLLAACIHEEIVERHLAMPRYVNYLGSFNVSYRRTILEQAGGFDTSYRVASGEDNDLAYRVIKLGHKLVFTTKAQVAHHHPENLFRYLKSQSQHGYWRMKLYRHHPDMSRGDVYGGPLDFVQPPLCACTLVIAPLALAWSALRIPLALLMLLNLGLQLAATTRIVRRTGMAKLWALAPITWLRSYARGMGMMAGLWDFHVRRRHG